MTTFTTRHYVTFYSPGTFVSETSTKQIGEWDTAEAVKLSEAIVERHGARPYAFRFETMREGDGVADPEGVVHKVEPTKLKSSGMYFIGGNLRSYKDVVRDNRPNESILRSNMDCNRIPYVCEVTRGYLSTHPFEENDSIVDAAGNVTRTGKDADLVAYREEQSRAWEAERSARGW